jgi:hypothetical protein
MTSHKKPHKIFDKEGNGSLNEAIAHIKSPSFTEEEYKDLLLGNYNLSDNIYRNKEKLLDAILESPYNEPNTNFLLFRDANRNESQHLNYNSLIRENAAKKIKFGNHIHQAIAEANISPNLDSWTVENSIYNNENITKPQIMKIMQDNPDISHKFISNPNADDQVINHYLYNLGVKNSVPSDVLDSLEDKNISPDIAEKILNSSHKNMGVRNLNKFLEKIPQSSAKKFIDKKLGIEGGQIDDEDKSSPEENWSNWKDGKEYDGGLANKLIQSKFLDDDQAEHVKRHGSLEQRRHLYENENIDPRHGVEMYNKWANDESDHGYDSEEYKDHLMDESEDNDDYHLYEQAREEAESNYSVRDYLDNNGIDFSRTDGRGRARSGISDETVELAQEIMDEAGHDWEHDNPDYDKEEADKWQKLIEISNKNNGEFNRNHMISVGLDPDDKNFRYDLSDPEDTLSTSDIDEHIKDNEHLQPRIDYSNSSNYNTEDHPEYEDRWDNALSEASDKINEEYRDGTRDMPDWVYDGHADAIADDISEIQSRLKKEKFENAHEDPEFVPKHLHEHIPEVKNFNELKRKKEIEAGYAKGREEEEKASDLLNQAIPNREHEHSYGEGLHHHEMLKEHADNNKGSIDIGTMNKLYPNLKEDWKKIFKDKGKLSSQEIEQKIQEIPKTKYRISYRDWKGMQNTNERPQVVFRLDHSPESYQEIHKDPKVKETFEKVQDASMRSGHPTTKNTIAWSRVDTTDPKHWFVDELQSDFGSSMRRALEQQAGESGHDPKQVNEKLEHLKTVEAAHKNWRENLMNLIIKEAKKHGVQKISTHSPESKAAHTGAGKVHTVYEDSYKKVPRRMGFVQSRPETLPLSEQGKKVFERERSADDSNLFKNLKQGFNHSLGMSVAHSKLAEQSPENKEAHEQKAQEHWNLASKFKEKAAQLDPTHPIRNLAGQKLRDYAQEAFDYSYHPDMVTRAERGGADFMQLASDPSKLHNPYAEHLETKTANTAHASHTLDLTPSKIAKNLELASTLIKTEILMVKAYLTKSEKLDILIEIRDQILKDIGF